MENVRALTKPYIGAHCEIKGKAIKIWKAYPVKFIDNNIEPGKVLKFEKDCPLIKTADGSILILEHEFTDKLELGSYL